MAIRFLNKSTIAQGSPRSSKVHDQFAKLSIFVDYLVVAGGGGGGRSVGGQYNGGGGGAGGYLAGTGLELLGGASITVTIGAGGAGEATGVNSVFSTLTSIGGGYGGIASGAGGSGGSGGGGSHNSGGGAGTAGPPRQGYNGGYGLSLAGGTGGGSSGQGNPVIYGPVGPGTANTITGASVTYATGGLGAGQGGSGPVNTGNGGSGAGGTSQGAAGGRGIVIIAYPNNYPNLASIGAGLTYTLDTTTRTGYKVYKFTDGTGTVVI
jgi:hypothetical protein